MRDRMLGLPLVVGLVCLLAGSCAGPARADYPSGAWVTPIEVSGVDAEGRFTVGFDPGPVAIYLSEGRRDWVFVFPIPKGCITEVRSFIGWDRGSIGEAGLDLALGDQRIYERSEHKESPVNYDAWKVRAVRVASTGRSLAMAIGAGMTAPNESDGGLSTRVEVAVRLTMVEGECK